MTLTIAVAGAGLGGLATAAELHRNGFHVQVYERGRRLREQGVGMHLGPNAVRLLLRRGHGPRLRTAAVRPQALEVRAFHDGSLLTRQEMGAGWERRFGAPYLTVHRGDLHRMLGAGLPGRQVHTGVELTGYEEDRDGVRLRFADGGEARADVLIGADGVHSVVRRAITGGEQPVYSGNVALRWLADADLVPELDPGQMYMFAGPAGRVLAYPVCGGSAFTCVVVVPRAAPADESWTSAATLDELRAAVAGWAEPVQQLASAAREVRSWALFDRDPLPRWSTARTTLLGDAAHPMLPHHGQGANQAVEDAVTLAACLDQSDGSAAGIEAALQRYEELRRPHTAQVQLGSRDGARPQRPTGGKADLAADVSWVLGHDADAAVTPAREVAAA
ncbi:FAD-dependent monooxygenase [Streptomyces boninensis]|uniref:FAD-dependent monooxygenase n=1 Tax=Streptomyces boninensis TaxID=2039455 RepID=UPI003B2157C9